MDHALENLSAVVHRAVNGFADKHQGWADVLGWPVDMVKANPAHARGLVTTVMARNAIVHHLTQPPATAPSTWDRVVQAGKASLQQTVGDTVNAIAHPIQATTDYIARNRVIHSGNHYLDRTADILGGAEAGMIANLILGGAKLSDLYHRYGPGQVGLVEDALAKRGLMAPIRPLADRAHDATAPLRKEAALRPPRTLGGKVVAAVPNVIATIAAPEVVAPALLGAQGVGAAYDRARQTSAPDGLRTDAGIVASGLLDAAASALKLRVMRGPEAADALPLMSEASRGAVQDFIEASVAKGSAAGLTGAAQQTGDNLIAKASFDPDRPWSQGVGESALISGLTAAPFGMMARKDVISDQSRPALPGPPLPLLQPRPYAYQVGGAHRSVQGITGYEAHHMPSDWASDLPTAYGPAIALTKADHKLTESFGSSARAKAYRQKQLDLIRAGDFAAAQDLDIKDIRDKFGSKYDDAIEQLLAHSRSQGHRQ
jgi:hypothetical protein